MDDLYVDASMEGLGVHWEGGVYVETIPGEIRGKHNKTQFEMYNVAVAFQQWGQWWNNAMVKVICYNAGVLNTLQTDDEFLALCLRNISGGKYFPVSRETYKGQ